jgi:hypothetical protein
MKKGKGKRGKILDIGKDIFYNYAGNKMTCTDGPVNGP